jgi:hypothetical protein
MNVDAAAGVIAEAIGVRVAGGISDHETRRAVERFAGAHFETPIDDDADIGTRVLVSWHDHTGVVQCGVDPQIAARDRADDRAEVFTDRKSFASARQARQRRSSSSSCRKRASGSGSCRRSTQV